jgi:hypothetical protein
MDMKYRNSVTISSPIHRGLESNQRQFALIINSLPFPKIPLHGDVLSSKKNRGKV